MLLFSRLFRFHLNFFLEASAVEAGGTLGVLNNDEGGENNAMAVKIYDSAPKKTKA